MKLEARSYGEDIAYIHDVGFGGFARAAAPNLLSIFRAHQITRGAVVDLGCGSGILARYLMHAGYDVTGIDISESMLRIARRRVPNATFKRGSLLSSAIPDCSAVTSIGECLNYLFDYRNHSKERMKLFHRIYSAVKPGGIFIFDILTDNIRQSTRKTYSAGKDWIIAAEVRKEGNRLTRRIMSVRKIGKRYRMHREIHRQLLLKTDEIQSELKKAGFQVQLLRGYGKLQFDSAHSAFLALKL